MRDISILLTICACLGVPVGLIFTSQATMGVALIGVCCFLAVLSRIVQASHHHRETMRALLQRPIDPPDGPSRYP